MYSSPLDVFDGVLYINLEMRKDRRKAIEEELRKIAVLPDKVHRIEAVHDELNGSRGCVQSHMKALDFALEKGWKNVLILEDDCIFIKNPSDMHVYVKGFFEKFKEDWDVFFLGTSVRESALTAHDAYIAVHFSVRGHSYAVNGPYMRTLRDHFAATYALMEEDLFFVSSLEKALDRQWAVLQRNDRWFACKEPLAHQRSGFSDIEKGFKPQR